LGEGTLNKIKTEIYASAAKQAFTSLLTGKLFVYINSLYTHNVLYAVSRFWPFASTLLYYYRPTTRLTR